MDVFIRAREQHPSRIWWAKASRVTAPPADIRATLLQYNDEGYECMSHDAVRNVRYDLAVSQRVREGKRKWLEIGPGAHAKLTKMVLKNHGTTVVAVEGNPLAAEEAKHQLAGFGDAAKVICGLSTDAHAIQQIRGASYTLVQEILGLLASSEGICAILADLRKSAIQLDALVPTRAATFCAPALLCGLRSAEEVYVAEDCFVLFRKLAIEKAWKATGGTGDRWQQAGLFEFLDFASAEKPLQENESTFVTDSPATVNGLSSWIWCETCESGSKHRLAQTNYPYGCARAPPRSAASVDFSSRCDDGGAAASAWRNVFFPFKASVSLKAGDGLTVNVRADLTTLTPSYAIKVACTRAKGNVRTDVYSQRIVNFYPEFEAKAR
jgi:hypothetical protein